MAYGRGVRGVTAMAVGQVHLTTETRDLITQAVTRCYPRESNGSLKSAMELILIDFLEIPVKLSPEDIEILIKSTESESICEALGKIGEEYIKNNIKIIKRPDHERK